MSTGNPDSPLPLTEHLQELRQRLLLCFLAVGLGFGISWIWIPNLLEVLARPVPELIFLKPTEAFMVRLKLAFFSGVFLSIPFLLYQAWAFIAQALQPKERRVVLVWVPLSSILFVLGAFFCWWVVIPPALKWLLSAGGVSVRPFLSLDAYVSFVVRLVGTFGLVFQLPVVVVALVRWGVVSVATLSSYRRHVIVGTLLGAALLTPGPDVVSQLFLALPTYFLFEVSLLLARFFQPHI